ncbi:MAG: hydroxymethylbilane synthase [Rhizobiales bacterium]|nr:hydroxymethylbilane synthase [Hyphomicrobiales bacterium]
MQTSRIRIGTRGSPLALKQAEETRDKLVAAHSLAADAIEIVVITTTGDRVRDRPLSEIGGKGLFTKEIEEALVANEIDLAVHSMKDMPAEFPGGLDIVCLMEREDPRDAFMSPVATSLAALPQGAVVGSSSVRRAAQAKRLRPDLEIVQYRGNVDTRLKKLKAGEVSATFLACAGLVRLGLAAEITQAVPVEDMLPAVAQGAIGIEVRLDDDRIRGLLAPLHHTPTAHIIAAERGFLCALDGSCRTPLAGHATLDGDTVAFHGAALTMDGSAMFEARRSGAVGDAEALGRDAAEEVKAAAGSRLFA